MGLRESRAGRYAQGMKRVWGFAGLLVAAVAIGGWLTFSNPAPRLDAANADLVSLGRLLYADHCTSCHGSNLEGQPNWRERQPNGRLPAPPHDPGGVTALLAANVVMNFVNLIGRAKANWS